MTKWLVLAATPEDPAHVIPIGDIREHVSRSDCWCEPTFDDGVMVHHAMDRREEYEQGRKLT
jgi:hypothetical protein